MSTSKCKCKCKCKCNHDPRPTAISPCHAPAHAPVVAAYCARCSTLPLPLAHRQPISPHSPMALDRLVAYIPSTYLYPLPHPPSFPLARVARVVRVTPSTLPAAQLSSSLFTLHSPLPSPWSTTSPTVAPSAPAPTALRSRATRSKSRSAPPSTPTAAPRRMESLKPSLSTASSTEVSAP
jgi:hypothetical protein